MSSSVSRVFNVGVGVFALTILPNATNGNSQAGVEITVLDENVGAVGLHRDAVIAVVDDPVAEGDVVGVDGVGSVGLGSLLVCSHYLRFNADVRRSYVQRREVELNRVLQVRAVDVNVLQEHVLRVNNRHCPDQASEQLFHLDALAFPPRMCSILTTFDSGRIGGSQ